MKNQFAATLFFDCLLCLIPHLPDHVYSFSALCQQPRHVMDISPNPPAWRRRVFTTDDKMFHESFEWQVLWREK